MLLKKPKIIKDWKKSLKSYSFLTIVANILTAVSVSALAVLGVLSSELAFPLLATLAIAFGLAGAIGRFIDQSVDDLEKGDEEDGR